ncbi:alpha-galactosidase [Albirhodobacter sp. R86504]|uniref:alpha-galactosidase n=1 Tax=Albirhodobacter sp. R86504 TaxID=3093848 RepID=UPI0036704699
MKPQIWHLSDARQSLVLVGENGDLPQIIYWGARLRGEDLAALARAHRMDVTGGMLDENPPLSICPEAARSFSGQAGLKARALEGDLIRPRFKFVSAQEGDNSLALTYADGGLRYTATFAIHPQTHIITAQASISSDAPIYLDWLAAPVFPAPQLSDEMFDFAGRWIGEFQMQPHPWRAGILARDNRTGRTGHEHFPAILLPARGATNCAGEVWALHYGWSGGHAMLAEELPDGRRQIQFGHAPQTEPAPITAFDTAPIYAVFSDHGFNGCATAYQRHLRDEIVTWPHPDRPRPVHYNCWEAVYFNHSLPELKDIATRAADLGAERFVLDDGWFGRRDDDTTSLGDWAIDPRKYPDGLGPLIDHIHTLKMTFGIWFEPEMVNPDSDIYRAHPDWALGATDQILGRQQMVFDMSNAQVREYLYGQIAAVLTAYDIDYIKWDHNRVLPHADASQARGTYALLDRLRADFPRVEIESCSSGGGRIDFGIMARTQRVWLSDSNDALERLRIQHNAALFLPMAVTGSHVGPRHCHTSGRVIGIEMRAWVAAARHMGFEMDPRELTDHEAGVLRDVTAWWKANRDWMRRADILRLDSADPAVIAEQQLAQDGGRFVVFAGKADTSAQILPRPLRLTALEADARYRIRLRNKGDAIGLSRGAPLLKSDDMVVTGQYLMRQGINLPWSFPLTMWVIEGERL